ncbi:hypothetical protein EZV73_01260 [Acidaminobacter sp. JC074]|uniref:hypothetical protein n=1 Tax=Acidaminobacter sp. JC074 TaxID=2530199 RepID=UPI001F0EC920|nr:hypothetical protein [Acidaminobacter sp. JC074]MCH4886171.1 hypothetical protein [Acidaminobacter sp. JC074]
MKKLAKTLIVTIMASSLLGAAAFADDTVSLEERIKELQDQGLTRVEIHATLEDEGYELEGPKTFSKSFGKFQKKELTEEQQAQMDAFMTKVEELKEQGLSREEMKEALEDAGFEMPNFIGSRMQAPKVELTEEQEAQLEAYKAKIAELKEQGVEREDMKAALEEAGFEVPDFLGSKFGGSSKVELTEEQQAQLEAYKAKLEELKDQGLNREEMKEALEEAGIELPNFIGSRMSSFQKVELTEEQQAQLDAYKAKVEKLKEQGLDREELKEALEEAGFEMPDFNFGSKLKGAVKAFGGRK